LGEGNGGIVLNISTGGLALHAAEKFDDDELVTMRFQLSQSETWVEAKGRTTWRSDSKQAAGVQFIGLSDQARKEIQNWISTMVPENGRQFPITTLAGAEPSVPETRIAGTGSAGTGTLNTTLTPAEDRSRNVVSPFVPSFLKPKNDREAGDREGTSGSRKVLSPLKFLPAVALLVLSLVLVGHHFRRPQRGDVTTRVGVPAFGSSSVNPELTLPPKLPLDRTSFVLQVGAMAQEENAVALADLLRRKSFPAFVLRYRTGHLYRVFVGPYSDAGSSMRVRKELKGEGFEAIRTKWPPSAQ